MEVRQAQNNVNYARQLSNNGCYKKAFDLYIKAFDKNPNLRRTCEEEFVKLLTKLNDALSTAGNVKALFDNFGHAIQNFPDNSTLLNDIGKYLYKYRYYTEAKSHFQRALIADPGYVNAEKNLNSVKNLFVERWHFRMLNDRVRNELYRAAIHESIRPTIDTVIDIGTGTGLLAFFANECRPAAITACDGSGLMTEMTRLIALDMGIYDIVIINEMSTKLNYKKIGGKRSLLITEMFDAGLVGEKALPTIAHAWKHLLNSFARVVPCRAEFFVCVASCNELHLKYHLGEPAKNLLNISDSQVHVLTKNEPYNCEDVHFFKDVKYITKPESLLKVNFNSFDDILEKLQRREPTTIEFKVVEDGEANIMIGWFNLQLSKNVSLTTDPRSPMRCNAWQQAVFFDFIPKMVKNNDKITSQFLTSGRKLTLLNDSNIFIHRISPETLRFLNDSDYIKMIMRCIGMACVYLGQIVNMSEIDVVDLCPFPVFGLQMLKRGAQSLICFARTYNDEEFIVKVMRANNIDLSKLVVLCGTEWTEDSFRDYKYHAIFCNPFELCGEIDLKYKTFVHNLKNIHLFPGGLFMPSKITVMGQIIDCPWLDKNNQVNDENVFDYRISSFMNKYQVSQNFFVNISHLEYHPITEPTCIGIYDSEFGPEVLNIPVKNNGSANAVLCWYNIEVMENLGEITTNRSNSFIDNMAFLADPRVIMEEGNVANVLRCVDPDGSFKLVIDVDALH